LSITAGSALLLAGLLAVPSAATAAEATGQVRITEWAYNGSEFVEFTNLDTVAVDITGWSFSDSKTVAGQVDLSSAGIVAPGASFVLSQASAADFRTEWALPNSVKVVGGNSTNLGRGDTINLFDSADSLVDSLSYDDEAGKGPRTDKASAWPSTEAVIGIDDAAAWVSSTAGDVEGSWTSTTSIIGSPGLSRFGSAVDWLRLNEIETDGTPDWVELINLSTQPLDASGFVVTGRANGVTLTLPADTVVAPGAVYVAESSTFKLKKGDKVSLFAPDGDVLLDSYEWGDFHLHTFGRVPNGTGEFVQQTVASKGELNPAATDPGEEPGGDDTGWASIKLNEVTSANDAPYGDAYELVNTGDVDVDVASWKQSDSTGLPVAIIAPNGTVVPAHGYLVLLSDQGLSSDGDSVKVYRADGSTIVDSVGWGVSDAQPGSWSRCGDATGAWAHTAATSWGASNATACAGTIIAPSTPGGGEAACQTEAASGSGPAIAGGIAWPGSQNPTVSDNECQFVTPVSGQDVSGLDIDPVTPDVMWAVKNKNHLYRLVKSDNLWVPDTTNGWSMGKDLVFPSGGGQPDTEGVTVGPDGFLYITTERDNDASSVPLDSVLRFDPNESGAVLHPTSQWDVTSDLSDVIAPVKADSNLGFEGITWVPDSYLTTNAFVDQSTGAAYDPADYPGHGTGLYFLALEKDGHLYAYALNADGTFHRVSSIATGLPMIQETQWDADAQRIWAVADNSSAGSSTLLEMDAEGGFVIDRIYDRPTGLPNNNNEGFAIAPSSTCVDGVKEVIRADDGNNGGHSLWSGTIACDLELGPQGPTPPAESTPTVTATPSTVQAGGTTTIVASGLEPDTEYTIVLRSEPMTLGSVVTDADGALTLLDARIAADTTPGAHTITVAAASDPATVVASTPLTVTAAAAVPTAPTGGDPAQRGGASTPTGLASTGAQPLPAIAAGAVFLLLGAGLVLGRSRNRRQDV
jgi:hypothetical protein